MKSQKLFSALVCSVRGFRFNKFALMRRKAFSFSSSAEDIAGQPNFTSLGFVEKCWENFFADSRHGVRCDRRRTKRNNREIPRGPLSLEKSQPPDASGHNHRPRERSPIYTAINITLSFSIVLLII